MKTILIRILLNVTLAVLVYQETGFWTALCMILIMFSIELSSAVSKRHKQEIDKITDILAGLTEISKRDHGLN